MRKNNNKINTLLCVTKWSTLATLWYSLYYSIRLVGQKKKEREKNYWLTIFAQHAQDFEDNTTYDRCIGTNPRTWIFVVHEQLYFPTTIVRQM